MNSKIAYNYIQLLQKKYPDHKFIGIIDDNGDIEIQTDEVLYFTDEYAQYRDIIAKDSYRENHIYFGYFKEDK